MKVVEVMPGVTWRIPDVAPANAPAPSCPWPTPYITRPGTGPACCATWPSNGRTHVCVERDRHIGNCRCTCGEVLDDIPF